MTISVDQPKRDKAYSLGNISLSCCPVFLGLWRISATVLAATCPSNTSGVSFVAPLGTCHTIAIAWISVAFPERLHCLGNAHLLSYLGCERSMVYVSCPST